MSSPDVVDLVVRTIWACVSDRTGKNAVFRQILSSEAVISEICSDIGISFSPGLLDAMQAESPPAVDFFRNLPLGERRCWAVYAVTMEKPSMIPQIYIGTGTCSRYGLRARFNAYDRLDLIGECC
jgi:hypothetical protein